LSDSKLSSFLLPKQEQLLKVVPVEELQMVLVQGVALGKSDSSLYGISLSNAQELWQESLQNVLPGWPSLQFVADGKACFTCFQDSSLPVAQGLYVFDLKKKEWAFKNDELTFVNAQGVNLLVRKAGDEEHYHVLDLAQLTLSQLESQAKWFKNITLSKQASKGVLYPYHIGEENVLYKELVDFVKDKTNHTLTGMVEYLEWSDQRMLVSYYIEDTEGMSQYLLLTDDNNSTIMHECIDVNLKGMAFDVFMVIGKQCVYVKNKTQLCVYNLT
jgi:hypothetical protein